MHIYFSGIGGTAIGPLAMIAHAAGFSVSGSDKQDSLYIANLRKHGVTNIHIGQDEDQIADVHAHEPIDWFVYTSALPIEQPNAPELVFCRTHNIKCTKRDELLNFIITEKDLKLIAIAGTHGKTTTTAMAIWLMKQLRIPVSYSVGAKLSFGEMGEFDPKSNYFIYEADEFDRNFLAFTPYVSLITGIDWDHPDIYPTRDTYNEAFLTFLEQSKHAVLWQADQAILALPDSSNQAIIPDDTPAIEQIKLPGLVNRRDAYLVARGLAEIVGKDVETLGRLLEQFPGVARRFEQIQTHLYTDYAHTPPKIAGALQLAREVAGDDVVVVYEGLHNTRQHFIKHELRDMFKDIKRLYIVPTYLAREDPTLAVLSPEDLKQLMSPDIQSHTTAMTLNDDLQEAIARHIANGETVLCISAGGGGSLDEWIRHTFRPTA